MNKTRYLALAITNPNPEQVQSLSPTVMKWSEHIWIIDLQPSMSYWRQQSLIQQRPLRQIWHNILSSAFGSEGKQGQQLIPFTAAYSAGLSHHPWKAVLLLDRLLDRGITGLISDESTLGYQLYRSLTWTQWWQQIDTLKQHLDHTRFPGYKAPTFTQHCRRLKLAIPRFNFHHPNDLNILNQAGVKRRFGALLSLIWNWTCQSPSDKRFPWQTWRYEDPITTTRLCQHPASQWQHLAQDLRQDLNKLCRQCPGTCDFRVIQLDWRLILEDGSTHNIPIRFRNPHRLQAEIGTHSSTLLQAQYQFEAGKIGKTQQDHDNPALITAWELSISKAMRFPEGQAHLFADLRPLSNRQQALITLENQVAVRLYQYHNQDDWTAEASSKTCPLGSSTPTSMLRPSQHALHRQHPLLLYQHSSPIAKSELIQAKSPLETNMEKWWQGPNHAHRRHYHKIILDHGEAIWAYKDEKGRWMKQGLFG